MGNPNQNETPKSFEELMESEENEVTKEETKEETKNG